LLRPNYHSPGDIFFEPFVNTLKRPIQPIFCFFFDPVALYAVYPYAIISSVGKHDKIHLEASAYLAEYLLPESCKMSAANENR